MNIKKSDMGKINVAEILKDKPQGTKLYDLLRNIDVELDKVHTTDVGTYIECTSTNEVGSTLLFDYSKLGTEKCWLEGLRILLPSKNMRDWGKFAWKKGDLLINSCGFQCIFKEWASDDYTKFNGCYSNSRDGYEDVSNAETAKFDKLDNNIAYGYVREIERKLGGILNLTTLEIEKQYEFKNGDIAFADYGNRQDVFIVSDRTNLSEGYISFISLDLSSLTLSMGYRTSFFKKDLCKLRLATEAEKQQLFDALEKEGKAWDAEKKQIVDLKPNIELKPFDKVLVRDFSRDKWSISFFSFKKEDLYVCINHCSWNQCIPYEGNESLLGTTKDVEVSYGRSFKKELIEHCKRQMQRFERMGRTDSFAYKEHAVLLSFLERPYLPF
nr:MAG: hypothetical protein [Bacteriophage sp.]